MRTTRTEQPSVFQAPQIDHTVGADLELASLLLDQHSELLEMVGRCVGGSATRGRVGLTCETILRCAVIARLMNFSYRELEFALHDSKSTQRFARVDPLRVPKKSALQSAISMIDARTWEQLDRVLLREAKERGVEARSPAAAIELRTEMTGSTNGSAPSKSPLELPQLCGALHSRATSPVQGRSPGVFLGGGQPPEHLSRTIELRVENSPPFGTTTGGRWRCRRPGRSRRCCR